MFPTSVHAELSKSHCPRSFISDFPFPPGLSLSPLFSGLCSERASFPHIGWTHCSFPHLPRDHTWFIKLPRPSESQATLSQAVRVQYCPLMAGNANRPRNLFSQCPLVTIPHQQKSEMSTQGLTLTAQAQGWGEGIVALAMVWCSIPAFWRTLCPHC